MNTVPFLAEWALRSSIVILTGGLLLLVLRVKDPAIRLAAWTAMLCASLAMPLFTVSVPKAPVVTMNRLVEAPVLPPAAVPVQIAAVDAIVEPFNWPRAALVIYGAVALTLLLRLMTGIIMSLRLLRQSSPTEETEIRESDRLKTPVTLGIVRPVIVLPAGWRQWSRARLDAVLAHERSHIRRFDPAWQFLSALHRALLWHSPLSWVLHNQMVRVAEEASDDAAVAVTHDRAFYAEVLIGFMQPGVQSGSGIPMARYGSPDARLHRILDGTVLSRGVTRGSLVAILAIAAPLSFLVAAANVAEPPRAATPLTPVTSAQAPPAKVAAPAKPKATLGYLRGLGNVAASATVVVRTRADGQLTSLNFKEGEVVQQGQTLASVDPHSLEIQLVNVAQRLEQDQAKLAAAKGRLPGAREQLEEQVSADQARISDLKMQMDYNRITSPIAGVTGLRMVDAGNMVHAGEPIVVVTQLQPADVLFRLPEDTLPQIHKSLKDGASLVVEAWNRDNSIRIGTGHLIAVDNQIDEQTGTIKLKATFDNKDGELIPGGFVNVRLILNGR